MTISKIDDEQHLSALEHGECSIAALSMRSSAPLSIGDSRPELPVSLEFGPSQAHRIWRMMHTLVEAHPEWADEGTFERARQRMLIYGLSIGLTVEDLFSITDPKSVLSLWKATLAAENDLWE